MCFLHLAKSESGKSSLSQCTVVKNLVIDVHVVEVRAHVRFHHNVFSFTQSIVESVMVHLVENCTGSLSLRSTLELNKVD